VGELWRDVILCNNWLFSDLLQIRDTLAVNRNAPARRALSGASVGTRNARAINRQPARR
jgi:hypothetical protein